MGRNEIVEKYRPGENDYYISVLNATHIEKDTYFCNIVHGDMDNIIRDIRETHKEDSTSAPDTTAADEIKNNLEEAAIFQGATRKNGRLYFAASWGLTIQSCHRKNFR